MPKKIFEVKFGEWEKGLSYETTDFVGGIFRTFTNCDPFEGRGAFTPTQAYTQIGSTPVDTGKTIRVILPVYASGGPGQFYALGDGYKMYLIDTNDTVTDVSAQIGTGSSSEVAIDAIKWNNKLLYAMSNELRQNVIPVSSGSDSRLIATSPTSNICIGPDRNAYIGISNNVGYVNIAGGTGVAVAASLETNNIVKKLLADGRYLLWVADNGILSSGKDQITLAWWNMASSSFDDIQEFEGGSLRGARKVGNDILILTNTGIYITRFGAGKPQLIVPFGGSVSTSDVPLFNNFMGIEGVYKENFFFWGTHQSSGNIFAYGNKIGGQTRRLFQMGTSPDTAITALASNNTRFLFATSGNTTSGTIKLYNLRDSSGSANTAIVNLAGFSLPKPYTFHSAKVILKTGIRQTPADSVSLQILTSNSTKTILASSTKNYSSDPNERNLIFDHVAAGDGSDVRQFDDISDVKLTTNVAVHSIIIYGDVVDDRGSYG
jgi:hypothetical protein